MLNIKHPHVLRLYALAVKSPYTYLVLEYCRHGALDDYLEKNRGKVSIEERLRFLLDASQGLSYVHQQGLTHRDVKLSNFLLTESMSVKVGDLGTAATSHDVHRTRVGTLDYCAPEVLDGQSYSNSCDVYSFGICLWRMFSDQPLYPDLTMYNIITKVVAGNRPPIDAITSPLLADLIQRCWKQSPSERPNMDQVTEALKAISPSDFISL
jgi:serine/threonine protein kinase